VRPLLGAHIPTAGGIHKAPDRARSIGAEAMQVFTRNQMQWRARAVEAEEAAAFREALGASGVRTVMSHGSYLVNLASGDPALFEKSRDVFLAEMGRCRDLGIAYVAFHPGAHCGTGEEAGLDAIARALDHALERAEGWGVMPLIEATAGQGSCVGHRFEHLAGILDRVRRPEQVGICLDTCHVYAAGYDISTRRGYEAAFADFDRIVGLGKLRAFHLNDSKRELGSRVDRHAPIGKGFLGLPTFRRLVRDPRFHGLPMVLETPGGLPAWKKELRVLRRLLGAGSRPAVRRRRPGRRARRRTRG
jgi:deoxyribonuclease IV